MNPAFSVVFLTTLIGAAQGLVLVLFAADLAAAADAATLVVPGAIVALVLSAAGLVASFFHLGRPERAWRTATMWRTSWLSREVIVLPLFMAACFGWGASHGLGLAGGRALGAAAALLAIALFVCTAMIYASIRFIQEWASVWTLVNYTLLGLASGATLAAALAAARAPSLAAPFALAALVLTLAGLATRVVSLVRNAGLRPKSTLQSAIGIRHPQIRQRAMGFMGGSFNTREFFHGRTAGSLRQVKWAFIGGAFVLPVLLLAAWLASAAPGSAPASFALPALAFAVQYAGLLAERWFFFAEARHPQNLYYQAVS